MNAATKAYPGLTAFLNRADGVNAAQALARVELHLSAMRDTVNAGLEEAVNAIGAQIATESQILSEFRRREIYQLADGILSVAAMYGKESLGKVAYSLCDLIKTFEAYDCWDLQAVRLHHDAMRVLQATPDLPADAQDALVKGLEKVVGTVSSNGAVSLESPT